jgi:adenosylcobinamide-GDP ribazoletransferase
MTHPLRVVDDDADDASAVAATSAPDRVGRRLRQPIDEVRAAVAMLTRLPVSGGPVTTTGVRAFALVGAFLGLVTLVPLLALGALVPAAAAILAVALLALLSGGLHLDGLADTFDALVAVGPDAAERARRDPAVGAAGATALMLVLALDVAALTTLLANDGPVVAGVACVVAGSVSRLVPAVVAWRARSAAQGDGLGAWFVRRTGLADVAVVVGTALVIALFCAFAVGSPALLIAGIAGGAGSVGLGVGLVRLRGTIDGDLLGASVEIAFAVTVLAIAILAAWPAG